MSNHHTLRMHRNYKNNLYTNFLYLKSKIKSLVEHKTFTWQVHVLVFYDKFNFCFRLLKLFFRLTKMYDKSFWKPVSKSPHSSATAATRKCHHRHRAHLLS